MEPVTTSGYYENDDGTVTHRYWEAGQLKEGHTWASWADVGKSEADAAEPELATLRRLEAENARLRDLLQTAVIAVHELRTFVGLSREAGENVTDLCDRFEAEVAAMPQPGTKPDASG